MSHRRHRARYEHGGEARYLTCSCYRRLPLFANVLIKDAFAMQLETCHQRERFQLLAWVIMPEHVHLLVIPAPSQTVSRVLQALKEPFARTVIKRWRESEAPVLQRLVDPRGGTHFWQRGGGYDRNIVSEHELLEKIAYIHANPVRRGLTDCETDWAWSSALWYNGVRNGTVQVDPFTP